MKVCNSCLFIIISMLLLLSSNAMAERKQSLLGDFVDGVKQATAAAKQDVDNFNTFIVTINATNKRSTEEQVNLFTIKKQGRKAIQDNLIASVKVPPKKSVSEKVEIKTSSLQRKVLMQTYIIGHKYDNYIFDPSKEDNFNIRF